MTTEGSASARDAITGGRGARRKRGEAPMVPDAEFGSYYGRPVIKAPVWRSREIAGYLFLGGLAGASSLLGAGALATGRPTLHRIATGGAACGGALSLAALVADLGRPTRFLHMLRVVKPSSPMNLGSWLLAGYVPAAWVAAASAFSGRAPGIGAAANLAAALAGPAVASYTAALLADTAVPAWHEGHRELPYVFVGSAATAAGGLGLLAPGAEATPARNLALLGVAGELTAFERMRRSAGMVAEPYSTGKGGNYVTASKALSLAGALGALLGRRNRVVRTLSGAALVAASAATRFGVFHAGVDSANDPRYTVVPQRERAGRNR